HPFLACSFWLVEQYAASGRVDAASELMARLTPLANDLGLLSEEYDVQGRRHAGNTPQALSHLALVRAADALAGHAARAAARSWAHRGRPPAIWAATAGAVEWTQPKTAGHRRAQARRSKHCTAGARAGDMIVSPVRWSRSVACAE